jgi:hypothetical protein
LHEAEAESRGAGDASGQQASRADEQGQAGTRQGFLQAFEEPEDPLNLVKQEKSSKSGVSHQAPESRLVHRPSPDLARLVTAVTARGFMR